MRYRRIRRCAPTESPVVRVASRQRWLWSAAGPFQSLESVRGRDGESTYASALVPGRRRSRQRSFRRCAIDRRGLGPKAALATTLWSAAATTGRAFATSSSSRTRSACRGARRRTEASATDGRRRSRTEVSCWPGPASASISRAPGRSPLTTAESRRSSTRRSRRPVPGGGLGESVERAGGRRGAPQRSADARRSRRPPSVSEPTWSHSAVCRSGCRLRRSACGLRLELAAPQELAAQRRPARDHDGARSGGRSAWPTGTPRSHGRGCMTTPVLLRIPVTTFRASPPVSPRLIQLTAAGSGGHRGVEEEALERMVGGSSGRSGAG